MEMRVVFGRWWQVRGEGELDPSPCRCLDELLEGDARKRRVVGFCVDHGMTVASGVMRERWR